MVHEIWQHLPFPFDGDRFPDELGVVVQRTILEGLEPIREVIHTDDNSWLVGDSATDTSAPALVVVGMRHLVASDETLAQLATLPLAHMALRDHVGDPWRIHPHTWDPD